MHLPDQPGAKSEAPDNVDSDILLSGETATTGADEAVDAGQPDEPDEHEPDAVDVSTPTAAAYWARRFQMPVEQVHEAVDAAGTNPERVAAHLGKPWPVKSSGIV